MVTMFSKVRGMTFSPLMLAILGIWFLANLLSQLAYISSHGIPYDGVDMLQSLGPLYYAIIGIELLLWSWLFFFLIIKLVKHFSDLQKTKSDTVNY